MIDADKLRAMNREQILKFLDKKKIVPVTDNLIKYKNTVYEIEPLEMNAIFIYRDAKGYAMDYDGIEKKPGDARAINHMFLAAMSSIVQAIDDDIKYNNLTRKIVFQQIK